MGGKMREAATLVLGFGVLCWLAPAHARDVELAPHRAVYEFRMGTSAGKSAPGAVTGRLVYNFSGSRCEGYSLDFRQVVELESSEGEKVVSDVRSITFEDGEAKTYRFSSESLVNYQAESGAEGKAERNGETVRVELVKPDGKTVELGNVSFPMQHMLKLVQAAMAKETLLEAQVFDGSENGEKVFDTLAVIGSQIPADRKPSDPSQQLGDSPRWPVTLSYFDRSKGTGDATPTYSIAFELFANGVSRAMVLKYPEFSIIADLKTLEMKEAKACP